MIVQGVRSDTSPDDAYPALTELVSDAVVQRGMGRARRAFWVLRYAGYAGIRTTRRFYLWMRPKLMQVARKAVQPVVGF